MRALMNSSWCARAGQVPAILAIGAGLCLITMVFVVFASVILRYVLNAPMLGVNEIVQLIAVALAMLALPYCTQSDAHVRVDLFDRVLGRWGRLFGDLLARGLSVITLYHLCARAWSKAAEAIEFGDVTNMLQMPLWPFYGAICAGMALCAAVFVAQMIGLIITVGAEHE